MVVQGQSRCIRDVRGWYHQILLDKNPHLVPEHINEHSL